MNIMVKPVSGHCNIDCRYCFYKKGHTCGSQISWETTTALIDQFAGFLRGGYPLVFQGGEPLLAGHAYFERLFAYLASKDLRPPILVQTNGTLLDDAYARLFADNNVLVGVSLDGTEETHNHYRSDFSAVMAGIQCLKNQGCEFNILTVITDTLCNHLSEVYEFYRQEGFHYQQYIPCMAPAGADPYLFLSQDNYERFLIGLYRLWREDLDHDNYVYIRYFENLLRLLAGLQPEECGAGGVCSMQFLVESDGNVYPCDFFVEDRYCLGNLRTDDLGTLRDRLAKTEFISSSWALPDECQQCRYLHFCRGGCKRYRDPNGKYLYCSAVKSFFAHALSDMNHLLKTKY